MSIADDLACRDFVELVTDYLEGALPPDLCASIEAHMEICSGCRLYLGQMRLTIRALHYPSNGLPPPAVREELLLRFREWRMTSLLDASRTHEPPPRPAPDSPGANPARVPEPADEPI